MLAALLNLGFAGGGAPVAVTNFGGGISEAISRQRLRRLAIQQGLRKDDDEILALILAAVNFTRRN